MNNFHYNQDPLYAAAAAILAGKTLDEQIDQLDEYESPHKTKAQKLQNVRDRIKETQERIAKIRKDQSAGEDSRGPRGDWLRIIDMHNADLKKLIAREKKIMKMTEEEELEEGLEAITSAVEGLKKGDKTNFGVVTDVSSTSISFKAKDLPITKIAFNQRKMGSKDFVLDKLVKLREEVSLEETESVEMVEETESIELEEATYSVAYIQKLSGGGNNRTNKQFSNLSSAEEFAKDNYSWVKPVLSKTETDKILKQAEVDMDKSKQLVNGQEEKDYKVTISGVPVTVTVYRWKMTAADKRANPNPNGNTGLSNDYMYNLTFDKQYKGIHDPDMGKAAQNAKKLGLKYNSSTSLWEETESIELDEAKGVNPADLRNIISNHTQLLTKATTPSAKEFHKVAIANAKEKLKALGEDADSITEVLDPDAEASVWIDDFVKSDDPKFDGKSKDERIKMALGAWYAAQKKESTEVTDDSIEEVFRPGADMVPAPIGKDTATSQGLKKLWGVQMRAGKWADTFVGLWDDSSDKPFGIIDAEGVTRYADITKFMTAFSKLTK